VDYEVEGQRFEKEAAFRTGLRDGQIVHVSDEDRGASEYRDKAALAWRNYEWTGRFRLPKGQRRSAFVFYSDIASSRFYQLAAAGSDHRGYSLLKGWRGSLTGLTESGLVPEGKVNYRFRIRVETLDGATAGRRRRLRRRGRLPGGGQPGTMRTPTTTGPATPATRARRRSSARSRASTRATIPRPV
jgi:hypothetical protein